MRRTNTREVRCRVTQTQTQTQPPTRIYPRARRGSVSHPLCEQTIILRWVCIISATSMTVPALPVRANAASISYLSCMHWRIRWMHVCLVCVVASTFSMKKGSPLTHHVISMTREVPQIVLCIMHYRAQVHDH